MFDRILLAFNRFRHRRLNPPATNELCFGRERLCEAVVRSAFDDGCVLLFGGRQSGKTTTLRRIARNLGQQLRVHPVSQTRIPVFVDLMRLPYDATPSDCFAMLARLSVEACAAHNSSVLMERNAADRVTGLESFERVILRLRSRADSTDLRFVYLLDESKRIIGDRFPRGFHDNLFHVLFGDSGIRGICNIVFAGAQELYRLCEDDTSPIGSRAAKHCLANLSASAVGEMTSLMVPGADPVTVRTVTHLVYEWTGGHAGLSFGLLKYLNEKADITPQSVEEMVIKLQSERSELFQLWVNGLTPEARAIHDVLLKQERLGIMEVVEHLRRNSFAVHRCDRVIDELQYVGFVRREQDVLHACNRVYSRAARHYANHVARTDLERTVWPLVEQVELSLRRLVRVAYDKKWGGQADRQIELALGAAAWAQVSENRSKYLGNYPASAPGGTRDEVLNFTYLGQIAELILSNKSWDLFEHLFRDKRELQDMIRDITPVRNDSAHFRAVPEHELNRCRVRCIDLLTIVERDE